MSETRNAVTPMHLAAAYEHVAQVNHYMVGITWTAHTDDELDEAEQLLIDRQSAYRRNTIRWRILDRALDMLDADRAQRQRAAARQVQA